MTVKTELTHLVDFGLKDSSNASLGFEHIESPNRRLKAEFLRSRITTPILTRYAYAVLAAIVAVLLRSAFSPLYGASNPYHTIWLAVVLSAWFCGVGPAIVTTLVSFLAVWYWFLPPTHSFALEDSKTQISGMVGFLMLSGVIIALGEANRRSRAHLIAAHQDLEKRVQKRTEELDIANKNLRQLSARLLQMQDDERRRIARDLHDSAGQLLTAIKMNIDAVQSMHLHPASVKPLAESATLLNQLIGEIRTIAHLLHPPLLDEVGLPSALRWYVDGFSQRSKIAVSLDIASDLDRFGNEIEIAIFRVVQECLTNVHRHSGSGSAAVRLVQEEGRIQLEIRDAGKGIPLEKQPAFSSSSARLGVGFRGMRERITQLGGTFNVHSDQNGTVVIAILPVEPSVMAARGRSCVDVA